MAINYYANNSFINTEYAIDIALFTHMADMVFNGDQQRIIYSSNDYALRKRSDENKGKLDLPFFNFRITDNVTGDRRWWNAKGYGGIYINELERKIAYRPIQLAYEATYWCHRDDELRYAFNQFNWDSDNKTILQAQIDVEKGTSSEPLGIPCVLSYSGNSFDPQYDESAWLEENHIHTASINFEIETFALKDNYDVTITEEVLFNFASYNGYDGEFNYIDVYNWTVDHLQEKVLSE
jgi:hypothetical protein